MKLTKQPAWVDAAFDCLLAPVIEDWEERRLHDLPMRIRQSDYTADGALAALNRITCSPHANDVWRALARFGPVPPRFLAALATQVHLALAGFEGEAITQKERKRAATKVRKLALQLAEELCNPAVLQGLRRARSQLIRLRKSDHPHLHPRLRNEIYPDPAGFLELANVAAAMARQPKRIGQPNNPNAARLYFMQQITNWINHETGTPMRSQVLALTSVFFDVRDLSSNDLTNLAPVSKLDATKPVTAP